MKKAVFTKNIELRSKNLYYKDLFKSDESAQEVYLNFTIDKDEATKKAVAIVKLKRLPNGELTIEKVFSGLGELTPRIEYRCKKNYDLASFDKALNSVQYWVRKIYSTMGDYFALTNVYGGENENENEKVEVEKVEVEKVEVEKVEVEKTEKVEVKTTNLKAKKKERKLGLEGQIVAMVEEAIESDEAKDIMHNVLKAKLDAYGIVPGRIDVHVKRPNGETKNAGVQHKEFQKLLKAISAKVNVALVGPSGSGKTSCVSNVAKALELPFYSKSVSAQTGVHEFFGYQDANGNYVRTIFREAFENGGVFLLDEFDAGNPNVLAALNQATANGTCAFADGMISKHEDFIVVMAGNTFGHGATSEYVGRNKIDAATLDRFAFLYFGYDEDFEYQLAENKAWCKKVQAIRKKVEDKKIKTIVSPRATFDGSKLLSVGMSEKEVMQLLIYKGLNKDEVRMLS